MLRDRRGAACASATDVVRRRRRPHGSRPARPSRCSGRADAARRRCCARSPACSRSTPGTVRWDDDDLAAVPAAPAPLRADVPGVRAVPAPRRRGQRGVRPAHARTSTRAERARAGRRGARSRRLGRLPRAARSRTLSGGEQQRVALARALAVAAALADARRTARRARPVAGATACSTRSARCSTRTQLPAIYVTHDQDEAFAIASRIAVMRDGRVVQIGTPADVWHAPVDAWTADFLGFGPVVDGDGGPGRDRRRRGVSATTPRSPDGDVSLSVPARRARSCRLRAGSAARSCARDLRAALASSSRSSRSPGRNSSCTHRCPIVPRPGAATCSRRVRAVGDARCIRETAARAPECSRYRERPRAPLARRDRALGAHAEAARRSRPSARPPAPSRTSRSSRA